MDDKTINLWRQINSSRRSCKQRKLPGAAGRPTKQAAA
jgi:hypothetical protein